MADPISKTAAGYFVIIDPDGGEVVGSRVQSRRGDRERNERIRADLQRKAGEGCFVEFVPDEFGSKSSATECGEPGAS